MKCKLLFCTCNFHGNCVYRYHNMKCIRIAIKEAAIRALANK